MRVHLGSDHAGLDLKAHLAGWLTDHGYEPVDHGPFPYDALDDYPVFCLRAAEAVALDRTQGLDSLGVVIGGSGNGEQIAANKVPGIRCALAWSEETASLAREHNDAQVVSVGGRMHSIDDMTRFVEVFLAHAVQRGRAARPPDRPDRRLRAHPRAAGAARVRPRAGRTATMPEGHTLHRLATALDDAFAGHPVRVSSPQGRFAESAALLDGRTLERRGVVGQAPVRPLRARRPGARAPRPLRPVRRAPGRAGGPAPVGQVRLRLVRRTPAPARRRTPTCAAPPRASCRRPSSATALVARLGPDPLRPDADPDLAWQRIRRSRAPIAGLLMDQSVSPGSGTSTVPSSCTGTVSTRSGRAAACGSVAGRRCGTTWLR